MDKIDKITLRLREIARIIPGSMSGTMIEAANLLAELSKDAEPVIDLKHTAYDCLVEAALKSSWMPKEYTANDWLHDCAQYLEHGFPQPVEAIEPPDYCHSDFELAKMIMSDCGISTINNENLTSRIADRIAQTRKPVEAIESVGGMTVIDKADDDALRFIRRVLESDAPEEDREAARKMIDDIRGRVRHVNSIEAIEQRVAEAILSALMVTPVSGIRDCEQLIRSGKWKEFVK